MLSTQKIIKQLSFSLSTIVILVALTPLHQPSLFFLFEDALKENILRFTIMKTWHTIKLPLYAILIKIILLLLVLSTGSDVMTL